MSDIWGDATLESLRAELDAAVARADELERLLHANELAFDEDTKRAVAAIKAAEADAATWKNTYEAWREWCERNHDALVVERDRG